MATSNHSPLWISCLDTMVFLFPKTWIIWISNLECTWWRLFHRRAHQIWYLRFHESIWLSNYFFLLWVVPDEGYYRNASYLMKVITETRRTWWRLLQKHVVPDEGYYRNTSYLMKAITEKRRTWWRLLQKHVLPDEGYYRNTSYLMKVITEKRRTWRRLLQKSVVYTK
jgi:hypothetical protein